MKATPMHKIYQYIFARKVALDYKEEWKYNPDNVCDCHKKTDSPRTLQEELQELLDLACGVGWVLCVSFAVWVLVSLYVYPEGGF